MTSDPFVEIEIESDKVVAQGQKITAFGLDPVREKFYDMRGLAPINPDEWHSAKLFYRQGKLMENFTDEYDKFMPLAMHAPTYQRMGYDQLRTYFTWRTKVLSGDFTKTSVSYVYLYMFELICGIGVVSPAEGLDKLMVLWDAYYRLFPQLAEDVPNWLKDYHIFYELPHSFTEFIEKHDLGKYYRETTMFNLNPQTTFANWLDISNYDISKSKFYNAGNQKLMQIAFYKVVVAMEKALQSLDSALVDLFYLKSGTMQWQPFEGATFYTLHEQSSRKVCLSSYEIYVCNEHKWITRKLIPYKHINDLALFIVKTTEFALCEAAGFRSGVKININKLSVAINIMKRLGVSFFELQQIIHDIAKKAYQDFNRIVVTVDRQNIDRIREEAEVTQDRLIVEDAEVAVACSYSQMPVLPQTAINQADKDFVAADLVSTDIVSPFIMLKNALTATELSALEIILTDPENIKFFANQNGIMLEVLVDGINEKAMDTVGDNILELSDTLCVYEEYFNEIENYFI